MTDARRALIWFLALIGLVFAGDRLFAWALDQVLLRSQFRFSRLYRGGNDADVIILGDSRGVHSFYAPAIEELTGLRTLNLSYNSMSTRIGEAVLLDYLDHNRAPRMVIVEVTSTVADGTVVSELRTYAAFSPRLSRLYAGEHPYGAAAGRAFHLLRLNSGFSLEALHYWHRSDQDWINRAPMPQALRSEPAGSWSLPHREDLEALDRIVRVLGERQIAVRLAIAPYFPEPLNMPEFANVVSVSVRRVDPESRILNYAGAIRDPGSFADRVHLNERGSRQLLALMVRDGVFAARPPAAP